MANVQGKFYRGETQRSGVTPTSPPNAVDEPVGPLNPPGSGNTTTYKQLGDTTDKSFVGKNGFVPVVVNENQLTLQPLPNADKDGLLDPGIVQWTGIGYNFNVSAALARFQGVFPLNSDPDILTLTTPDATNDRIDLFILQILFDGDGIPNGMEADFITGTPAGSPIKPQINPATQIELTSVLVTAGSTTPTLTEEVVYDENTEWTGSTAGTGTGVFNSAVDPYQGTVSVETTNIQNGFQVQFNSGSEIDISTYQTFGFQINLKASLGANQNLYVTFLDGSLAPVSNFVLINLNKSLTGYQFIGIALNAVNFTSFDVQYIRFSFVRTSGPATYSGYFLDIVKLEGGIAPPVTQNTFLNLTDTPSSYIGQASKVVSVKADETGLEFTTASGGASTFLALTDTPSTYAAQANKWPRVNVGETALVFDTVSPYDLDQEGASDGDVLTWVAANSRYEPVAGGGGGITGSGTTNEIAYFTGATAIASLSTATYPSLTELSYVKGVTSSIQTQINTLGSKWTENAYGIYRNSNVSINHVPIVGEDIVPLIIKPSIVDNPPATNFVDLIKVFGSDGTNRFRFYNYGGLEIYSNAIATSPVFKFQNGSAVDLLSVTGAGISNFKYVIQLEASTSAAGNTCFKVTNSSAATIFDLRNSGLLILPHYRFSVGNFSAFIASGSQFKGNATNTAEIFIIENSAAARGFTLLGNLDLSLGGNVTFADAKNLIFNTTTGTKIGSATSQKIAFWNKTPIIQPTTAITGAAFVSNAGTTVTSTDTFGGYTIAQLAAILINTGLTA